jgi:hypothetical protein
MYESRKAFSATGKSKFNFAFMSKHRAVEAHM